MPRSRLLLGASAVLLALGCQLPTPPTGPMPSAQPSQPTGASPALPSVQPSAPAPSVAPTAAPVASATPSPSPSPSALMTVISGRVFNDEQVSVAAATLTATNVAGQQVASVVADGSGVYTFPALPNDQELTISAGAANYTARQRQIVPNGGALTLDWNGDWALTNRPEIIAVSPADGASGVSPTTPIELTFSVGVNQNSASSAFAIQLDSAVPYTLPVGFTLPGADWPPRLSTIVMDASHFVASWPSSNRLRLEPQSPLPTVTGGNPPGYRITMSLEGRLLQSLGGRTARESALDDTRNVGPFNIGRVRAYSRFSVATATSGALRLTDGIAGGNRIRIKFSQPMCTDLTIGRVAGGVDGTVASAAAAVGSVTAAAAAGNYTVAINGAAPVDFNTLAGAKAYFDDTDKEHKTVILETDNAIAGSGQTLDVRLKSSVRDPMGRIMVLNDTDNKVSLHSF